VPQYLRGSWAKAGHRAAATSTWGLVPLKTEGQAADGTPLGVERLADIRHSAAGLPAPETMCASSVRSSSTRPAAGRPGGREIRAER
jgi:hypothetical protein